MRKPPVTNCARAAHGARVRVATQEAIHDPSHTSLHFADPGGGVAIVCAAAPSASSTRPPPTPASAPPASGGSTSSTDDGRASPAQDLLSQTGRFSFGASVGDLDLPTPGKGQGQGGEEGAGGVGAVPPEKAAVAAVLPEEEEEEEAMGLTTVVWDWDGPLGLKMADTDTGLKASPTKTRATGPRVTGIDPASPAARLVG